MITLSLLKFLEDQGVGVIDETLFFQKMPPDVTGVYIADAGGNMSTGTRTHQNFEIYSRGDSDVSGYQKLEEIGKILQDAYPVCELPAVPPITDKSYVNVTIEPTSPITSLGMDQNGRTLYSIMGRIIY